MGRAFHTAAQDDSTAFARWSSLGPYYAMFPVTFAREVIANHTRVGDAVVDPFAGRGTSLFCALQSGRQALGVEINPLGWIYGQTKIAPATSLSVIRRIDEIEQASSHYQGQADRLPEFFRVCYCRKVRSFLIAARSLLKWRTRSVDRTLMAFLLVYLHGKLDDGKNPSAFSNQMRQTKAMAPDYSVRWWRANGFDRPPNVDPAEFLKQRVLWRYAKGVPTWDDGVLRLGDCRRVLPKRIESDAGRYKLLLTSPPYRGVTSYYYDQWLRFWLLGDPAHPTRKGAEWKGKYEAKDGYERLIKGAFSAASRLLSPDATLYVRTDARPQTFEVTRAILQSLFPNKTMECKPAPYVRATQTHLFGDRDQKPGEVDIILH